MANKCDDVELFQVFFNPSIPSTLEEMGLKVLLLLCCLRVFTVGRILKQLSGAILRILKL